MSSRSVAPTLRSSTLEYSIFLSTISTPHPRGWTADKWPQPELLVVVEERGSDLYRMSRGSSENDWTNSSSGANRFDVGWK